MYPVGPASIGVPEEASQQREPSILDGVVVIDPNTAEVILGYTIARDTAGIPI